MESRARPTSNSLEIHFVDIHEALHEEEEGREKNGRQKEV